MIDNEILRGGECEKIFPELSAYIDGELDEKDVTCVEEHLEKCEKCRKLLKELSDLSEDIVEASIPYPDDLHSRLMGALNEEMSKGRKKSRVLDFGKAMKKHGMWLGAGVAAVICLVLVGSPVFRGSLEFAMNDSKSIEMEDASMPQNCGVVVEMSRTGGTGEVYYSAEEAEKATIEIEYFSDANLADNADNADDMEMTSIVKSDIADEPEVVTEIESENGNDDFGEKKFEYKLLPSFMLPRGELGWSKTELTH